MFSDCSCRCSGIDYLTIRADDGWSLSRGSLRAPSTRRSRSAPRVPAFTFVGLPDKAVAESRERVRGALNAIGLGLPPKRITVNLAPADLPKEGSHYDLPIALGLMAAVGAVARDAIEGYCVLGELALDGSITTVAGALPAAIGANALGKGLICPASYGAEAAWAAADMAILAPSDLLQLINSLQGASDLAPTRSHA
jgi:magnesium chelatase family protein